MCLRETSSRPQARFQACNPLLHKSIRSDQGSCRLSETRKFHLPFKKPRNTQDLAVSNPDGLRNNCSQGDLYYYGHRSYTLNWPSTMQPSINSPAGDRNENVAPSNRHSPGPVHLDVRLGKGEPPVTGIHRRSFCNTVLNPSSTVSIQSGCHSSPKSQL